MTRQLVFVHGRSQERKDADALKREWLEALQAGMSKSDYTLPIADHDVRFPYYGQTLHELISDRPPEEVAEVIVRGAYEDNGEREFMLSVVEEVRQECGLTEDQLELVAGREVVKRGPGNWEWIHAILKGVDRFVPGASGATIAMVTHDVYQYLKNPGIRDPIEQGVRAALTSEIPTVVVSHSLGTVVAYNLLLRDGVDRRWVVPLFVTLGSPLAIKAIKRALRPIKHPPCADKWFNAMDERDLVALYPLDKSRFDVDPSIENKTDVDNDTKNRHGISGYLKDKTIASKIYELLSDDG